MVSFKQGIDDSFGFGHVEKTSTSIFVDTEGDEDLNAGTPKFATAVTNPFGLVSVGGYNAPTFADIEGDGDLDAFIGNTDGNFNFFQNTGSASNPKFAAPQTNPFGLTDAGIGSTPTFTDIDGDGDLDAFTGDVSGNFNFFQNTGSASNPKFAAPQTNPFGLTQQGYNSAPTFADIEGDGDLDIFSGNFFGDTNFFLNISSPGSLSFEYIGSNPFNLGDVGYLSTPTFADIEGDGDLDALIGNRDGNILFFQNTDSPGIARFAAPQTNPFGLTNVGGAANPTFADIDGDGDLDAFIGDKDGNINFFLNTLSLSGAGGQQQFTIASGDGTVNISNFGGIGSGVNPVVAVIAEVDTLQFVGADLTPEKLLLTQQGDDLELSFEGVADTKVILGNFALEDLDNLTKATGTAVNLGNILFDSQSKVKDSFDVFNGNQQRQQVFNRNSVTFLNDLDNTIEGFSKSNDVINGQGGSDQVNGRSGDDLLRGSIGRDKLMGGEGDDILVGGQDDDLLRGGRGKDLFILAVNAGTDTVKDFKDGKDHLGLAGGLTLNQLMISQSSGNTLISIKNGGEVLACLTRMNADLIDAADFTTV